MWDYTTANRPDYFIANSKYTARRIKKTYNRPADVIYPPVDTDKFGCVEIKQDYYVTASRLVPYKRADLIVEAFTKMKDKKLIVIGEGSDMAKIKAIATPNIEIKGYLPAGEMTEYMQNAKAFVFAAEEDFGITPVEALACGTPVIALNKGGTAESITDLKNGIHLNNQSPEAVIDAVERLERNYERFSPGEIHEESLRFSRKNFEKNITEFVNNKTEEFFRQ